MTLDPFCCDIVRGDMGKPKQALLWVATTRDFVEIAQALQIVLKSLACFPPKADEREMVQPPKPGCLC
jgi:hypothetical protein